MRSLRREEAYLMDILRVKGESEYVLNVDQGDGISIIHLKGVFSGGPL